MPKVAIPADFLCPITHELMKDPVSTVDGQIYERSAIEKWLATNNKSPLTGAHLESKKLVVIPFVKNQIEAFFKKSGLCTKETFEEVIAAGDEKAFAHLHYLEDYLESKDSNGFTPLGRAVRSGKLGLVELLLAEGADREAKDTDGRTPLALAAYEGHAATVETLLKAGADREAKDTNGKTPLALAACEGHAATVETLLKAGADREAKDTHGMTPLALAACTGQVATLETLLKAGANREAKATKGMTPLAWAACAGQVATVEALLKAGADREAKDESGRTPLAQAAGAGQVATVETLLKADAEIETLDAIGNSPLHYAACAFQRSTRGKGYEQTLAILLNYGANPLTRNYGNKTASEMSMDANHKDLARLIQTHAQEVMAQLPRQFVTLRKMVTSQAEEIAYLKHLCKALQAKLEMPHVEESKKLAASSSSFSLNVAASDITTPPNFSFALEMKDTETTSTTLTAPSSPRFFSPAPSQAIPVTVPSSPLAVVTDTLITLTSLPSTTQLRFGGSG